MTEIPDTTARVRLDRELIIDTMVQLARENPTKRISLKRLGEALGVDATAMYRHFRNVQELNRAGLNLLLRRVTEKSRESTGSWRDRLEQHIITTVETSQVYPSIMVDTFTYNPIDAGDLAWIEFVIELLEESGLEHSQIIPAYSAISGFSLAFSASIAQQALSDPRTVTDSDLQWIPSFGSFSLENYPRVLHHRDDLLTLSGRTVFHLGAAAILDSIEARIAAQHHTSAH